MTTYRYFEAGCPKHESDYVAALGEYVVAGDRGVASLGVVDQLCLACGGLALEG